MSRINASNYQMCRFRCALLGQKLNCNMTAVITILPRYPCRQGSNIRLPRELFKQDDLAFYSEFFRSFFLYHYEAAKLGYFAFLLFTLLPASGTLNMKEKMTRYSLGTLNMRKKIAGYILHCEKEVKSKI